jgi:hypothetical protein
MKKTIFRSALVMMVAVGITTSANSQEQKTAGETGLTPKIGVKGGVNLSNLYVQDVGDENLKVGGNVGLFAKIPVTRGFSVQPEVLYSMKGSQVNYNNLLFGSGKYRFNLDYVEVPVLAVVNVAKNFNLHFGPYAALLTSAKVKKVDESGNVNGVTELNKDNFNSFDYGAVGGLGFDVENVTLGARYNYGLREVGREGRANDLTKGSKNSVISFYIGFGF